MDILEVLSGSSLLWKGAVPGRNRLPCEEELDVHSERPRARRYPFVAAIEVTDVEAETQFVGLTSDVSVYGCAVNLRGLEIKKNLFLRAKTVRVRIIHAGTNFVAMGKVAYANPGAETGIAFTQVEPLHQAILEKWIDQAKKAERLDDPSRLASGPYP